jgi:tetratricopeptide (TPR) repeat protein
MQIIEEVSLEYEKKIKKTADVFKKIKLYKEYRNAIFLNNPQKASQLVETAYKLAIESKNDKEINDMLSMKGLTYVQEQKYDQALTSFVQAKNYYFQNNHNKEYCRSLGNIANLFFYLGAFNQAVSLYKELYTKLTEPNDEELRYITLNNLIIMYQNNFEFYESSESQILSILKNLETQGKQKTHLYHICYSNLANCFRLKKEYHKAIEITNKAISMAKENDLIRLVYEFNCQLGSIYLEIKDEEKMQLYLERAKEISRSVENAKYENPAIYEQLYLVYKKREDYKKSLENLEHFQRLQLEKTQSMINIKIALEKLELGKDLEKQFNFVKDHLKNNFFNMDRVIFEENVRGQTVKIYIDNIINIVAANKFVKIILSDNKSLMIKKSFKEMIETIEERFKNNHLMFATSIRKEVVNLYWLSKFEKSNKKIYLNVIGEEYRFDVARRQMPSLIKFLSEVE